MRRMKKKKRTKESNNGKGVRKDRKDEDQLGSFLQKYSDRRELLTRVTAKLVSSNHMMKRGIAKGTSGHYRL